jgi:Actin
VVRTIKEKCCYVALNPAKEEKDSAGRSEEFRLPDGNTVQVCKLLTLLGPYPFFLTIPGIVGTREISSARNFVQSRINRAGIRWCSSSSCGCYQSRRHGPKEELILKYRSKWW